MTAFNKTFRLAINPLFFIPYAILIVLSYIYFDQPVASYFYQFHTRTNFNFLNWLTLLGESKIYILVFLMAALYCRFVIANKQYEGQFLYLLICVFSAALIVMILKITLGRARPELLFSKDQYGFYWLAFKRLYWSFPSGHTITVVSLASALAVLFPRYFYLFLLLAIMVVLTRVLLYYHYLADVMAGFYIAIINVGLITTLLKNKGFFKKYHLLRE